jgi:hypothetical protein
MGILGISNRFTGAYLLECAVPPWRIEKLLNAVTGAGETSTGTGEYTVVVKANGKHLLAYHTNTLLVITADGELLESRSLLP